MQTVVFPGDNMASLSDLVKFSSYFITAYVITSLIHANCCIVIEVSSDISN